MKFDFDFYKDDNCYGCKHAKMKKDAGMFSRKYGCICDRRTDFAKRGEEAIACIQKRDFDGAIRILHYIQEDRRCLIENGWIEPYCSSVYCPFKEEEKEKVDKSASNDRLRETMKEILGIIRELSRTHGTDLPYDVQVKLGMISINAAEALEDGIETKNQ